MERFTNPFNQSGDELFNLVTKVVVPDDVKGDLCAERAEGEELLNTFVKERIQAGSIDLWSKMKKPKLLTWKSIGKKAKLIVNNVIVEVQEDRSLFARTMMVCQTRPEINVQEAVGMYEFTVVLRALFAADGSMLHCPNKSSLMSLLEKEKPVSNEPVARQVTQHKVEILDGMAALQSLDKRATIQTYADLSQYLSDTILQKHEDCDELHLVFDRYDVLLSLKTATRVRRQGEEQPVSYRVSDTTHIAKVPVKWLVSHTRTKMEITKFLSAKLIQISQQRSKSCVVMEPTIRGQQKSVVYGFNI